MQLIESLEEILLGDDGVLTSIRIGDGLKKDKVLEACKILDSLAIEWSGVDCIPKRAVDLFVHIYPVLESSCEYYSGDEARDIRDVADQLMDKVRNCITL
jgi:hypothetical protein